jgi:hypothetical protein
MPISHIGGTSYIWCTNEYQYDQVVEVQKLASDHLNRPTEHTMQVGRDRLVADINLDLLMISNAYCSEHDRVRKL